MEPLRGRGDRARVVTASVSGSTSPVRSWSSSPTPVAQGGWSLAGNGADSGGVTGLNEAETEAAQPLLSTVLTRPRPVLHWHQAQYEGLVPGDEQPAGGRHREEARAAVEVQHQISTRPLLHQLPPNRSTRVDETDVAAVIYALHDPSLRAADVKHHLRSVVALTFNSPDAALRACQAGGVQALVAALQRHYGAPDVAERACWALQCIASHTDEARDRCAAEGAVQAVLAALDSHVGTPPVVERACSVLAVLCASQSVRDVALQEQAARRTVAAMAVHANHAGVQERACSLLASLGEWQDAALDAAHAGAIAAVVSGMRNHRTSATVAQKAASALLSLSAPMECKQLAVAAGAMEALVVALRAHGSAHSNVAETGSRALACMACADSTRGRAMTSGAPALVITMMASHPGAPGVAEQGCGAIATFADSPDTRPGVLARAAIAAVCEAMAIHGDDIVGVAESGAWALQTLVADAAHTVPEDQLLAATQACVSALRAHTSNAGVCTQACALLASLATAPGDVAVNAATQCGGLEAVAACLRLLTYDVTASEQACGALRALLPDASCRAAAAAAGAVVAVCNCLRAHVDEQYLQVRGLAALEALVCGAGGDVDDATAAEVVAAGGAVCCVSAMAAHPNDADIAAVSVATLAALDAAAGVMQSTQYLSGAETPSGSSIAGGAGFQGHHNVRSPTPDADTFRAAARAARVRRRARGDAAAGGARSVTSMSGASEGGSHFHDGMTPGSTGTEPRTGDTMGYHHHGRGMDYGDEAFAAGQGAASMAAHAMTGVPRMADAADGAILARRGTPSTSYLSRADTPAPSEINRATDVVAVTATLKSYPYSPAVATAACATLARLSALSDAHAAKAVNVGAAEAVVKALQMQPGNASLGEAACMAMGALLADGTARRRALAAGAMDCVLGLLSRLGATHAGLAEHACAALQTLCSSSDGCITALDAGAIHSIISCALDAHPHSTRVCDAACGAIAALASAHEDAREAAVSAGALRSSIAVLHRLAHAGNTTSSSFGARTGAQEAAAQLVAVLCVGDSALVTADACGAPEALCSTLLQLQVQHRGSASPALPPSLAVACSAALRALAAAPWLKLRLHACGAPAACAVALRAVTASTHSANAMASRVMSSGAGAPNESADIVVDALVTLLPPGSAAKMSGSHATGAAGLVASLAVVLLGYAANIEVVAPVLASLLPRTVSRQERAAFAAASGVDALRCVLGCHGSTNEDIARDASGLLSTLGGGADGNAALSSTAVMMSVHTTLPALVNAIGDGADAAKYSLQVAGTVSPAGQVATTAEMRKHLWALAMWLSSGAGSAFQPPPPSPDGGEEDAFSDVVLRTALAAQAPAALAAALTAGVAARDVDASGLAAWCIALLSRRGYAVGSPPSAAAKQMIDAGALEACMHTVEVLPAAPPLTERVADALHALFCSPGNTGLTARSRGAAASAHDVLLACYGRHAGNAGVCSASMLALAALSEPVMASAVSATPSASPSRPPQQELSEVVARLHVESTLALAQEKAAPRAVAAAAHVLKAHGCLAAHSGCVIAASLTLAAVVAPLQSGKRTEVLLDTVTAAFDSSNAADALVKALSSVRSHPSAATTACQSVSALCADASLCASLGACGGVATVVSVLEIHPEEQALQDAGFWALHALRADVGAGLIVSTSTSAVADADSGRMTPGTMSARLGGPRAAIEAIAAHPTSAPVTERACAALAQCTAMTAEEASAAMDTALTCVVRLGSNHPRVAAFGLAALATAAAAHATVKDAAVAAGGCELATGCMNAHKTHPLVAEHACSALGVLASNEDYAADEVIFAAIRSVVDAMKAFPTHWRIATAGCAALRSLCVDDPCKEAAVQAGAPEQVLGTLRSHGSKAPACGAACGAALALSLLPAAARRLASLGAIPGIVAAMRIHGVADALVAERGCSALTALAMYPDMRARVLGAGAALVACQTLTSHRSQARVVDSALRCLLALAADTPSLTRLADANAPEAVAAALSWHANSNAAVCDHGAALMAAMAADDSCRSKCGPVGAVAALHAVLRSNTSSAFATVAERAATALALLASGGDDLAMQIGANGGARLLVDTMRMYSDVAAVQTGCLAALLHCTMGAGLPPMSSDTGPLASVSQLDAVRLALQSYMSAQAARAAAGGSDPTPDGIPWTEATVEAVVAAAARALRVRLYSTNAGSLIAASGDEEDNAITQAARALVLATVQAGDVPDEGITGAGGPGDASPLHSSTRPASAASTVRSGRSAASGAFLAGTRASSASNSRTSSRAGTPVPSSPATPEPADAGAAGSGGRKSAAGDGIDNEEDEQPVQRSSEGLVVDNYGVDEYGNSRNASRVSMSSALTVVSDNVSHDWSRGGSPAPVPEPMPMTQSSQGGAMSLSVLLARNAAADKEVLDIAAAAMAEVVAALKGTSGGSPGPEGSPDAGTASPSSPSVARAVQEGAARVVAAMKKHATTVNSNIAQFTTDGVADIMNAASSAFGGGHVMPLPGTEAAALLGGISELKALGPAPSSAVRTATGGVMPPSPRDAAAAAMTQIVDALLTRTSLSSLAERGTRAVANYIALDANREDALAAGMVSCLVTALLKHAADGNVGPLAAWALVTLADSGGDNATRAVQSGACMAALGVLRAHPRNDRVAEQALRCACALAGIPAGLLEIESASGHRDALRALHFLGASSPGCAAAAANMLALTWPQDESESLTAAAAMVLSHVLGVHAEDSAVTAEGLAALTRVASYNPKAAALGGAFGCAADACSRHSRDPKVVMHGAALLAAVTPHLDDPDATSMQLERAMAAIIRGLKDHGQRDASAATSCLSAIAHLAKLSPAVAQHACSLGIAECAMGTRTAHGADAGVTAATCAVFAALTHAGEDACIARVTSCGGVEMVCDALRSCPDSQEVAASACATLESLTRTFEPNKRRAVAAGGVELVVAATVMHASHADAAAAASAALRSLAWHPQSRVAAASAGAVEAVVAVLLVHEMVPSVVDSAAGALKELAVNNANKGRATSSGAIEALVHALRAHGGGQPTMVASCAGALALLSVDDSAARRASEEAAVNALVACLKAHEGVAATAAPCMWALATLCDAGDTQICHKALRLNALGLATMCLAKHGHDNAEVGRHAARLMSALARCPFVDDAKTTGSSTCAATVKAVLDQLKIGLGGQGVAISAATAGVARSSMAALTALCAWPNMRAEFQEAGGAQVLVDALGMAISYMATTASSADGTAAAAMTGLAQDACAALQALALGPDGGAVPPPPGAVQQLVIALSLSTSADVAASAASALHALGLHPAARAECVDSNVCDTLLAAVRRQSVQPGVQSPGGDAADLVVARCFGALAALCDLDGTLREAAMMAGGVHIVVAAIMAASTDDEDQQRRSPTRPDTPLLSPRAAGAKQLRQDAMHARTENCLRFLHSICANEDACEQALVAGALPACCACMRVHAQNLQVITWTNRCIVRLCKSPALSGAGDAPSAVVQTMQMHNTKGAIIVEGAAALAALAAVDERAELVAVAGGVEALVSAVWGHMNDDDVIAAVCLGLGALCRSAASRRRAADAGAAEALVSCVSSPSVSPSSAANAITALLALAAGGAAMPAVAARLRATGVLASCMAVLTANPLPPVQSCAAALGAVARLLAMPGGGDAEIVAAVQGAEAACSVLAVYSSSVEAAAAGCELLSICAGAAPNVTQAVQTAVCAGFMHSEDAHVQAAALTALAALNGTRDAGTAVILRRHGVLSLAASAADAFPYDGAVRGAADAAMRSAGEPQASDGHVWDRQDALDAAASARVKALTAQEAALAALAEVAAASDARAFAQRYEESGDRSTWGAKIGR